MKKILTLALITSSVFSYGQEIFQDGKKYGISKFGDNPEENKDDSLIFRADYDEIIISESSEDRIFAGLREDEWSFLTSNKLVNQQRYETITMEAWNDYSVGYRDGYIDIYDPYNNDFLIRGVQANELSNEFGLDLNDIIVTKRGKDLFGVINSSQKKEILKAEYTNLYGNYDLDETFIAFKEGTHFLYKTDGTLLFKLNSEIDITEIIEHDLIEGMYLVKSDQKKGDDIGFYYPKEKWFVQPIYKEIKFIKEDPAVAVVFDGKEYGLVFQGKLILECEWENIEKSNEQGTVCIVTNKKGEQFYAFDDGKLKAIK